VFGETGHDNPVGADAAKRRAAMERFLDGLAGATATESARG
jgi:hypothetical protein